MFLSKLTIGILFLALSPVSSPSAHADFSSSTSNAICGSTISAFLSVTTGAEGRPSSVTISAYATSYSLYCALLAGVPIPGYLQWGDTEWTFLHIWDEQGFDVGQQWEGISQWNNGHWTLSSSYIHVGTWIHGNVRVEYTGLCAAVVPVLCSQYVNAQADIYIPIPTQSTPDPPAAGAAGGGGGGGERLEVC